MEGFIFLLLINMLWIGPLQVGSALFGVFIASNPTRRKHFGIYLMGVASYFSVLYLLPNWGFPIADGSMGATFFFGGALSLMAYHLLIVFAPQLLSPAYDPDHEPA